MSADIQKSGGIYYGWVVYVAVCVCMFLACAFTFNTASIYYESVATAFGTGRANVGFYMTLVYASACVANLFWAGPMLQKFDLRLVLSVAVALVGVALLVMSNAQSIVWFYVAGVLMGLGNAWLLWLIVPVVVGRWFKKNRGTLIGVGMACTSISGTLLAPVFSGVIQSMGWRTSYLIQAILVLVICLPLALFVVRSRPEDKGLKPLGWDDPAVQKAEAEVGIKTDGITLKQALKKPGTFILCCVFAGLANIGLTMNYFFPSFTTSIGYDAATGALVASTIMLSSLFGKLILGFLNDRSILLSNIIGIVPMMIGLVCMILFGASNPMWLYFGAVCFGIFFAVQPTNVPQVARKLFGTVSYDRIFTYVAVVMPLAAAFGSTFWGLIYDMTGSYQGAFVIDIIIGALALIVLIVALKTRKGLWEWAAEHPEVK